MNELQGPPLGLYVHWPYCARICSYCDFNVRRDRGDTARAGRLVQAIVADIAGQAAWTGPRRLVSVFFGGGTPSRLDPAAVAKIVQAARAAWSPADDLEISLEANPGDCDAARLVDLAGAGVQRLSLGVQSFDDARLRALGRDHDANTARRAVERAAAVFPRVSLDMIWGLAGDAPDGWSGELRQAIGFGVEHISTYELTFEPGTAFDRARRRGTLAPLAEPARADLHETTDAVLGAAGYEAYEVSNHARGPQARCRHNQLYWRGGDWAGVGPGAHARLTGQGRRWAAETPRQIEAYVECVGREGRGWTLEPLEPREAATERLLMGLRTLEGVRLDEVAALEIAETTLEPLASLIVLREGRLVATRAGRNVLDALVRRLVA